MKRTIWMTIAALVLVGASNATAQSLGDYARNARKNKPKSNTASRQFDNDNLPTTDKLSVVGPEPAAPAAESQGAPKAATPDPAAAKAEHQKAVDELQKKIQEQQAKIDALTHELDLDQREYRLRAAAFYGDAGSRLRNAAQWEKDDAKYKTDIDAKQKAIDAARQRLDELQEQARRGAVEQKASTDQKPAAQGNDKDKAKN